jgi:EAL domain-containing protein (putative c-di-GMP-specific phosphodiesterase class I)
MNEKAQQRLALERDLRLAIERGELEVYYQPKVDISTGRVAGMEALLRWNHPEKGLIPPATFIPLAEETGLIIQIGEFVLKEACKVNRGWQKAGLGPIIVAVNLSAKQFKDASVEKAVVSALKKAGLSSKYLELEITESVAMDNVSSAIGILCRLKDMGMELSIDDFGTGYSSFAYLKRFPIGALKIDKMFVNDIAEKEDAAEIISAMISMAHSLNLKVVAEGVETEDQLKLLRKLGCDQIQGYVYSRPLSADNATELFKQNPLLN